MKKSQRRILISTFPHEPLLGIQAINCPNKHPDNPNQTWCYGIEIGLFFLTISLIHVQ